MIPSRTISALAAALAAVASTNLMSAAAAASNEIYTFDYGSAVETNVDDRMTTVSYHFASVVAANNGHRMLAGETTCDPVGAKFLCTTNTTIL